MRIKPPGSGNNWNTAKATDTALIGTDQQARRGLPAQFGLHLQQRLTTEQAKDIASCQSAHRDISLNF